ncbi:MAG: SDR family oxidoreductase [Planctomycetota bacterium]
MDRALADLIRISNFVGGDTKLVQGGGGNTSVKTPDGKYMYIKASGTSLAQMNSGAGWRKLRLDAVLEILEDKSLAELDVFDREMAIVSRLQLSCADGLKTDARPSVESHLHARLNRCVIHIHPIAVDAYVCARNGRAIIQKLFKNEKYPPLWMPYFDPGYSLAVRISRAIARYEEQYRCKPEIVFLEKHGLLVNRPSASGAIGLVKKVIKICETNLHVKKAAKIKPAEPEAVRTAEFALRRAVFNAAGDYVTITHHMSNRIWTFMKRPDVKKHLSGILTPDELAYAGGPALWLEKDNSDLLQKKLIPYVENGKRIPAGFLIKGLGFFVATSEQTQALIKDVLNASIAIRDFACDMGGINPLNRRQSEFIDKWESETFRQSIASASSEGILKGRIAVVSGAGSGLGRSIAAGLTRAGALTAFADIDLAAAEKAVKSADDESPDVCAISVKCDVTDEADIGRAFGTVLKKWGGLDILINAAGIAPAYPLVDLPVEKWRQTVELNLTGYFLMAKAAAGIMIHQGMGGSIINISSKSGLEASRNNTPYNATKAGEIHMARGWAMELGQYGIRVNCVAPGNVFEGSKIWNPRYIKVCAKKYGIKPEEVIPYYVDKTMLKREIKGQDVADSVIFLCSDKARTITGQIIVPDSGQVMVR